MVNIATQICNKSNIQSPPFSSISQIETCKKEKKKKFECTNSWMILKAKEIGSLLTIVPIETAVQKQQQLSLSNEMYSHCILFIHIGHISNQATQCKMKSNLFSVSKIFAHHFNAKIISAFRPTSFLILHYVD